MNNLSEILKHRYSTKKFDATKKVSDSDLEKVKELLQLSASSTNLQAWHFIIAKSDDAKKKVALATQDFSANTPKIQDSAFTVVFLARTEVTDEYLQHVITKEEQDGRFPTNEQKEQVFNTRKFFVNLHKEKFKDIPQWLEKQVYINLGFFLLGTEILGLNTVPIEGFSPDVINREFGLTEKGFTACVLVSVGYKHDEDINATLPKSRLEQSELIEVL